MRKNAKIAVFLWTIDLPLFFRVFLLIFAWPMSPQKIKKWFFLIFGDIFKLDNITFFKNLKKVKKQGDLTIDKVPKTGGSENPHFRGGFRKISGLVRPLHLPSVKKRAPGFPFLSFFAIFSNFCEFSKMAQIRKNERFYVFVGFRKNAKNDKKYEKTLFLVFLSVFIIFKKMINYKKSTFFEGTKKWHIFLYHKLGIKSYKVRFFTQFL